MTISRLGLLRLVRDLPCFALFALLILTIGPALHAGKVFAAETRSHTHHASLRALPASSFVATGTPHTPKGARNGTRGAANAASARSHPSNTTRDGASGRAEKGGKARHGRSPQAQPDTDPIPMVRIGHRAGHTESSRQRASASDEVSPWHKRGSRSGDRPALVDGRGRRVSAMRLRALRSNAPVLAWSGAHSRQNRYPARYPDRFQDRGRVMAATGRGHLSATREATAAEGPSRPEDDEPLPRSPGPARVDIGSAVVIAANIPRPPLPSGPVAAQVVQGFGAEIALAPTNTSAGDRPGGTRRRDHPLAASALPGLQAAPSLEERAAITEAAVSPALLPDLYDRNGHLVMPAPLKGSRVVLLHQNTMATSDGLGRIQDDGELNRLRIDGSLVNFPVGSSLRVNEDLPLNRRCARPWTVLFATDIAHDFFERFHQPLVVTSAVRTVSYQARLQRVNGNAAATDGDMASPHLTGQALDFGKRGMSAAQLAWMRAYLLPVMSSGKIDVEEEFQQACFHISVYRRYAGGRTPAHELAQVGANGSHTASAPAADPQTNF